MLQFLGFQCPILKCSPKLAAVQTEVQSAHCFGDISKWQSLYAGESKRSQHTHVSFIRRQAADQTLWSGAKTPPLPSGQVEAAGIRLRRRNTFVFVTFWSFFGVLFSICSSRGKTLFSLEKLELSLLMITKKPQYRF